MISAYDDFRIFPNFKLDVEIPSGFFDHSWKNDVCPKWYNEYRGLMLFIEYKDPECREIPSEPRFLLCEVKEDQEFDKTLLLTDNYQLILNYLKRGKL